MTIRDAGELVIWLGAIAGALIVLGTFLRLITVGPMKRSFKEELAPVDERLLRVEQGQQSLDQRMSDHILSHK